MAVWLAESGWAVPFRDCACEAVREASARAGSRARDLDWAIYIAVGVAEGSLTSRV
jgi:hypothetical protein